MRTVGLVACVRAKRHEATEARLLYNSPLFVKAREYVEKHCERWYILSAKYGLLDPHDAVLPYEETLNHKTASERVKWAERVWAQLRPRLHPTDEVVILAGERYREHLVPRLTEYGCATKIPMAGMSIGRQLQWLTAQIGRKPREQDLERFYFQLRRLERGVGGARLLSTCAGTQNWPTAGIYFFMEPGELRSRLPEPRVVRVGTHGVSRGSKATLWNRLRTHRGTNDGMGNHRSSIFRLHVGNALSARDPALAIASWGIGQVADASTRARERLLERAVSQHIGNMSVLWLAIGDDASPTSDRAYLERNLIGLLAGGRRPADAPSPNWLGRFSPDERIRASGLWNLDFIDYACMNDSINVFEEYVSIALGNKPLPSRSIAPDRWHVSDQTKPNSAQLPLFGDR